MHFSRLPSPLGPLLVAGDDDGLHVVAFDREPEPGWVRDDAALADATAQLHDWFLGARRSLDVRRAASGTPFQRAVWDAVAAIPWGETRSYGQIADQLDRPGASRAVGLANGANPLALVVPCHRVVGADGSLTGYAGGLERKRALLELEEPAVRSAERLF